jgi:hypothetical protein
MNGETHVAVEEILAAAVYTNGGRLEITSEAITRSYENMVIAVDYDLLKDMMVITLVERDEVDLGD